MAELEQNPTLEQPQQQEEQKPEIDVDALLGSLEKAGVRDAKALEGKFEASRQAGNLANQLGNARAEIEKLTQALQSAETRRPAKRSHEDYEDFDMDTGRTVDLEELVTRASSKAVSKAIQEERQKQMQAQQYYSQVWNNIQSDQDFPLVREVWEAKMQDPNFFMKVNNGQVDLQREYSETVRGFYKNLLSQARDSINLLKGKSPAPPGPRVETSGSRGQPQNLVNEGGGEATPEQRAQAELLSKTKKGYRATDDEILNVFGSVIDQAFNKT